MGIAYWLYNEGPIQIDLDLDEEAEARIRAMYDELGFRAIDQVLIGLNEGWGADRVAESSGLSRPTMERLQKLASAARVYKRRELGARLD